MSERALGAPGEKRAFCRSARRITLPIIVQNFMDCAVSAADVVMLSFVSQEALSASSLAGQVNFIFSMFLFGTSGGAAIMTAQYWGKKDTRTIEKVQGIALRFTVLIACLFALAAFFLPRQVMGIYTNDSALIGEGIKYLRAVAASYVLNGFCSVYLCTMRSVERVGFSAVVHSGAVVMNVLLNACFIFGVGPFPRLGITGVALATSVTRALEAVVCVIDSRRNGILTLRLGDITGHYPVLLRDFIRYALPATGNDMIWGMAFTVYSVILGHMSADVVAANSLNSTVRSLATVVCYAVSGASGVILGKVMGEGRLREAKVYAARLLRQSVYTSAAGGLLLLALRPLLMGLTDISYFKLSDTAVGYFGTMLYISSYYVLGQSINSILISGIFRAGGDVKFGLVCDTFAMWAYAVPVGLIAAFVLKLPPMWVYFVLCLDEFVKIPVVIAHYFKYKWLRNITRDIA